MTPLLVVKHDNGHYLATLVLGDGGDYEDKIIGDTPSEAAEYIADALDKYGTSLDAAIPEHLFQELPNKCAKSGQLLSY